MGGRLPMRLDSRAPPRPRRGARHPPRRIARRRHPPTDRRHPTMTTDTPPAYADRITPSREWDAYVTGAAVRHPGKLTLAGISRVFLPYYGTGQRIRVTDDHGFTRTGRVSA